MCEAAKYVDLQLENYNFREHKDLNRAHLRGNTREAAFNVVLTSAKYESNWKSE
jgi:hypothetical protein